MTENKRLKPGDLVFVGEERPLDQAVIWSIEAIVDGNAHLRSGMTERRMVVALERLTPFTPKRLQEPA